MGAFFTFLCFASLIAGAIAFFFVQRYNQLQVMAQKIRESHSNVMVMMKKRVDLANQLVNIASGYGEHEKLTHISLSQNVASIGEAIDAAAQVDRVLSRVTALATNYPELKANETYQQLMNQLQSIEDELQSKRESYNAVVREYNTARNQIPMVFFANSLGFEAAPYFEVEKADTLESLKEFRTDDGELLKSALEQAAGRALERSQDISKSALQAGQKFAEQVQKAQEERSRRMLEEGEQEAERDDE